MKLQLFISTIAIIFSINAYSDVSQNTLLQIVKADPSCDEVKVKELLRTTELDENIVYEAIKNKCVAILKDKEKLHSWKISDSSSHALAVEKRLIQYIENDTIKPIKISLNKGSTLTEGEYNYEKIGFTVAYIPDFSKDRCDELKTAEWCSFKSKGKSLEKELLKLFTKNDLLLKKRK